MSSATQRLGGPFPLFLAALCLLPSTLLSQSFFIRGDADASGHLSVVDAVRVLSVLFLEPAPLSGCTDARDVDDNGVLEITDGLAILSFLFQRGAPPLSPFPFCGEDLTEDGLSCESFLSCEARPFGLPIEDGSVVIFLVDRSGSMQSSGELSIAKAEVSRSLQNFSAGMELGVVFVDARTISFPASGEPVEATEEQRAMASKWVAGVPGGAGSSLDVGLAAALRFAEASAATPKVIVFAGDGGGTSPDLLDIVRRENTQGVVIHTVGILNVSRIGEESLRLLAVQNGGRFTLFPRQPAE